MLISVRHTGNAIFPIENERNMQMKEIYYIK